MKKLLLIALTTLSLYAEATFEQVQSMIGSGNYKQAVLALTVIAENHPNSSKVQYTLAQAQAGLGNLPAANAALDKALALNPKLDFVPADQVKQLQQAIQPQVKLIKPVPTGPSTLEYLLVVLSFGIVAYLVYRKYSCKPKPIKPEVKSYSTSSYQPSYSRPNGRPTEVHHHYYDQSRSSDLGTTIFFSKHT
jgi:tetratricopeptide (TPR) repeat protein